MYKLLSGREYLEFPEKSIECSFEGEDINFKAFLKTIRIDDYHNCRNSILRVDDTEHHIPIFAKNERETIPIGTTGFLSLCNHKFECCVSWIDNKRQPVRYCVINYKYRDIIKLIKEKLFSMNTL